MNNAIILVKHIWEEKRSNLVYAFQAPKYKLDEGDKVLVDTESGVKAAVVVKVFDMPHDELTTYLEMNNHEIKKVLYKLEPLKCEEENDDLPPIYKEAK